jgi:hypothetical protein
MCWFREGFDDSGEDDSFEIIKLLDLKPYCYCPHFEGDAWQTFEEYASTRKISSIACENGAALCLSPEGNSIITDGRDAKCWFFDAFDHYKKYDLSEHPEILVKLYSRGWQGYCNCNYATGTQVLPMHVSVS